MLESERERLSSLKASAEQEQASEEELSGGGSELTLADQHPADSGTETFERERASAVADGVADHLRDVEDALARIERGEFGRCEACGREIAEERLLTRPSARYCIEDQQRIEQERRA